MSSSGTEKKVASKFLRPGSLQIAAGLVGKGSRGNIGKNFSRLPTIGRGTQLDSLGKTVIEPNRMHSPVVNATAVGNNQAANVGNNQGTHSANKMHDPFGEAANIGRGSQSTFIGKVGTHSKNKHVPIDDQNANPNIIANDVHNSEKTTLLKRSVPATGFKSDSSNKAGTCSRRRQRPLDAPNSTPTDTELPLSGRGAQPPTGTELPLSGRGAQPPTGTELPLSGRGAQPPTGTELPLSGRGAQLPTGTELPLSGRGAQPPTGTELPLSGRGAQPPTGTELPLSGRGAQPPTGNELPLSGPGLQTAPLVNARKRSKRKNVSIETQISSPNIATKDDEVRALVAWVGWVDGCPAPSAQDYLVSRRNAFFFCVESQHFMSFDFPAPFTIVETAPAITETESDHNQEGLESRALFREVRSFRF
ncbi:hypothetical protein ACFE04_030523 [Oxalis oulophora]